MESRKIAVLIAEAASEKQAADAVVLDVARLSSVTDFFVICSGETDRQLRAIVDGVRDSLHAVGMLPFHVEGTSDSDWMVMDYGVVVFHAFTPTLRRFYDLERLWAGATPILRLQ